VRVVVGFAAGGPNDILARLMGHWLSQRLGQPFVIENRPGASSNIATEAVVRAPADGYTILLAGTTSAINATLYDKLNFNFMHDIAPVASIMRVPNVMEVNPSLPVKTVPEFIAYAKANPGRISMASSGNGAPSHVAGELFKMMADVDLVHVPYRGAGPALTDLLGGQVQVYFAPTPGSIEHIKSGKLRALAVTSAARSEALPDVATVGEFVAGYEASTWFGIGAPKNTPAEVVDKLNTGNQRGPCRCQAQGTTFRAGRRNDPRGLTRRFRHPHCRRNHEVGEGREVRGPQAGVKDAAFDRHAFSEMALGNPYGVTTN
jgi:tripartite-type tricarboxylate transporter receptor subunit TctC